MAQQHYGVSPWGKWFIEALGSYGKNTRLEQGQSYANTGKVLSLEIQESTETLFPNFTKVVAKVKGHYRPYYTVEIMFPELKEKERVLAIIEEDPSLLANISAGNLPEHFLERLKAEGINLIPTHWKDMRRSCSCPDWGNPCKHLAALYYIIAREIDADPRVLFRLRGIDLSALAERYGATLEQDITPPFMLEVDSEPRPPIPEAPPDYPDIPHCAALILSLLPADTPFCNRDFSVAMADFYHNAAHSATQGNTTDTDTCEHEFSRSHWSLRYKARTAPILIRESISGEQSKHPLYETFEQFRSFCSDDGSRSYRFLFHLFKLLNLICATEALVPAVLLEQTKATPKKPEPQSRLHIVWKPFDRLPLIDETLDAIAAYEDQLMELNAQNKGVTKRRKKTAKATSKTCATGRSVVNLIASSVLGEWVRRQAQSMSAASQKGNAQYRDLLALFFQGKSINTTAPAMRSLPLSIARWLSVLSVDFTAWKYRLSLSSAAQNEEGADFKLSMETLLPGEGGIKKIPLKNAVQEIGTVEVLRAPQALSHYLPELTELTSELSVCLSETRLIDFLDNAAPLISRLGIEVVLPKNLHRELKPRLVLATTKKTKSESGSKTSLSFLRLDELLDWEWKVAIGDQIITPHEFKMLVEEKRSLVKFREEFIRIDPEELARLFKQAKEEREPTVIDFLKSHFAGDSVLSFDAERVMENLFAEQQCAIPSTLKASLRPYQERGYRWISSLFFSGFGCVLADDMGLGKTIQSITVLLHLKENGLLSYQCLVIAPASLIENWERELTNFAPSLTVTRYHGAKRELDEQHDVFLTTYQTAVRDSSVLADRPFSLLIVDEAHLMKNADTRGAKTVKSLHSQYRLALSGTPVENRLEDMRSLFDFILPGYLGNAVQFKEEFRNSIEVMRDKSSAERLRRITAPFLMRRLKTDKNIIADLPDKIITNEYAVLEKGQAALYESVVTEILNTLEHLQHKKPDDTTPQRRSNLILSLLTSLKQICDHPRLYDKESPAIAHLSGKAKLLLTLLQGILASGEKTLVFSQYVEALDCLKTIIEQELGESALIYHGGLSQQKRSAVIDHFQNDPANRILLVSLHAGGLGLNLTAASHVMHYDLWYNPAAEHQATDRAFRIGQQRNVFVHRFITKNSFEEKIDAMLSSKRELADMSVSSGESWLARMSEAELRTLFDR
ncbi:MAG: DEAD/DEAH box helicase [Treponema sp.]|jgi:SNF2 family DNA or RNA helicase/uncharacterized Zn finger protein|nr:DEAD/DEAH box helicase [Treponema sp.]